MQENAMYLTRDGHQSNSNFVFWKLPFEVKNKMMPSSFKQRWTSQLMLLMEEKEGLTWESQTTGIFRRNYSFSRKS